VSSFASESFADGRGRRDTPFAGGEPEVFQRPARNLRDDDIQPGDRMSSLDGRRWLETVFGPVIHVFGIEMVN
jgi:hypothetical protein